MPKPRKPAPSPCPCGGAPGTPAYEHCCRPFIEEGHAAPTAERLMRSRYTAYTLVNIDYLLASWHPSTRPSRASLTPDSTAPGPKWLGLTIHDHRQIDASHAQVRFTARYREAGRGHRMTELSNFVLEDGRWFYVDGEVSA